MIWEKNEKEKLMHKGKFSKTTIKLKITYYQSNLNAF